MGLALTSDFSLKGEIKMTIQEQQAENFEKGIHNMFDHIWECEIEHPVFTDTVGDLMRAVIQLYKTNTGVTEKRSIANT